MYGNYKIMCVQTGDALVQVVCGLWMLFFLQTSDRQTPQRSRINKEDVLDIKSPLQTDAGTRGLLALSCNNKRAAVVVARPAHTGRGRTAAGPAALRSTNTLETFSTEHCTNYRLTLRVATLTLLIS